MNRKQEQAELLFKLGQLLGPSLKMADDPAAYDSDERTRIMARFYKDMWPFIEAMMAFSKSEVGHDYYVQHAKAHHLLSKIQQYPAYNTDFGEADLFALIKQAAPQIQEIILSIPVPVDSTIHEAQTPFTTYCLVRNLCSTVAKQIIWLDRYFDQTIFHRYFTDTPATVQIALVTWPRSECKGKKDLQRYDEFIDLSKLFAQERGPKGYRLITNQNFHDRWLRCDDKLFSLGGSIKDIGKDATFTISRLDSTADNLKQFDEPIQTGTEAFGSSVTVHTNG